MNISDILRHKKDLDTPLAGVVVVEPSDTLARLVATLTEYNVGAVVVTAGDDVAGIVSERDVVRAVAARGAEVLQAEVGTIMTTDVFTCTPDDTVNAVAESMTQRRIRHLPVVENGSLVGIVSIGDVVSSRIRELETDRAHLEGYISG